MYDVRKLGDDLREKETLSNPSTFYSTDFIYVDNDDFHQTNSNAIHFVSKCRIIELLANYFWYVAINWLSHVTTPSSNRRPNCMVNIISGIALNILGENFSHKLIFGEKSFRVKRARVVYDNKNIHKT